MDNVGDGMKVLVIPDSIFLLKSCNGEIEKHENRKLLCDLNYLYLKRRLKRSRRKHRRKGRTRKAKKKKKDEKGKSNITIRQPSFSPLQLNTEKTEPPPMKLSSSVPLKPSGVNSDYLRNQRLRTRLVVEEKPVLEKKPEEKKNFYDEKQIAALFGVKKSVP